MTEEKLDALLVRLIRKLKLSEPDETICDLLTDELMDAESELLLYLNRQELPPGMDGKVVELAALFYRRDSADMDGLSAASYSEGQVSQSETYLSPAEYRAAVADITRSVAQYRLVGVKGGVRRETDTENPT